MWRRTYDSLGYSPLRQINRSNVKQLRQAWSWMLPQSSNEITPLVHDGVMFVYSGAAIQALDAATGDLLWQYTRSSSGPPGFGASHGKALAIHGDRLFASTADNHMIALDFRTGKVVWDQEVIPKGSRAGLALNSAPIVAKRHADIRCQSWGFVSRRLLHHRPRCRDRRGTLALQHDRAPRPARRR